MNLRTMPYLSLITQAALAGSVVGGQPPPGPDAAVMLVSQLGAARFPAREAAARQLREMRGAAIPALTAGTRSPDEEVRSRCQALLPDAKVADWQDRAEAFLADPGGRHRDDPVLFAGYEDAVGKLDDGSRKLFAHMLRAAPDLFVLALRHPEAVDDGIRERCKKLSKEDLPKRYVPVRGTAGELAALFFLHERARPAPAPWAGGDHPAHQLANPGLADGMADRDIGPALRRLVVHWAGRRPADDVAARSYFIMNAGVNKIPEAVPLLARAAKDRAAPRNQFLGVRFPAVWALGRIGTPDAVAALEDLLTDQTPTWPFSKGGTATLADSALAALATARGKAPADYGVASGGEAGSAPPVRVTSGGTGIVLEYYWFPNEGARKEGLKKWKADAAKPGAKPGP